MSMLPDSRPRLWRALARARAQACGRSLQSALARWGLAAAGPRALAALCLIALVLIVPAARAWPLLRGAQGSAAARPNDASEATFDSPRAVMQALYGYFESQHSGDESLRQRAAQVFDLPGVPARERAQRGLALLETRLAPILDRFVELDPQATAFLDAQAAQAQDAQRWTWTSSERSGVSVSLVFVRRAPGDWRISSDTVEHLDALWNLSSGLPLLAGLQGKAVRASEALRELVPASLKGRGFLLEPYQWIGLLVLVLIGVVMDRLLMVFLHPLAKRAASREGGIEQELLTGMSRPISTLVVVVVFLALLPVLDLPQRYHGTLKVAASLVLTAAGVWAAYRLVDVLCWFLARRAERTENRFDDMLVPLLRRTLKVFVVVVGILFIASRLSGEVWSVFAGLSIGSLALGFAAKDSIENLFGTFTVLLDNPFKLGDLVQVGDFTGTIELVGFRSTRVRTPEDTLITVPNSRFIASDIENLSARRKRRVNTVLSLTYDTPPESIEAFCEGARELIRRHPWTAKDSYHVWFTGFGSSSLDVTWVYFIETPDFATFLREQHRMNLDVLRLAERLGVDFAFPTQTMHVPPSPGERSREVPADRASAVSGGRSTASELSQRSLAGLAGGRPPPVRFDGSDPDAAGPAPAPSAPIAPGPAGTSAAPAGPVREGRSGSNGPGPAR